MGGADSVTCPLCGLFAEITGHAIRIHVLWEAVRIDKIARVCGDHQAGV